MIGEAGMDVFSGKSERYQEGGGVYAPKTLCCACTDLGPEWLAIVPARSLTVLRYEANLSATSVARDLSPYDFLIFPACRAAMPDMDAILSAFVTL